MIDRFPKTRRPRRQLLRFKGSNVSRLVPNLITIAAACVGLTAIRFAAEERWDFAIMAILAAAVLDALDGRMARLLDASSEFGAQLDSLVDIVNFGVAPALVLYFWSLQAAGGAGWAAALFLVVCCGLRLARFNSMLGKLPPYAYNYFTGVPAPAGALLSLAPISIALAFGADWIAHSLIVGAWTLFAAGMMVSRVPTYSFKRIKIPQPYIAPLLVVAVSLLAGLASYPWTTLTILVFMYLSSLPFSIRSFYRLKSEAEKLNTDEEMRGEDNDIVVQEQQKAGTVSRRG